MQRELKRRKPLLSLPYRDIQGRVGKNYVIKQYSYGAIRSRYPKMDNLIATAKQQDCRSLFKKAVAYAQSILADPLEKEKLKARTYKIHRLFNAAVKEYMLREKRKKESDNLVVEQLLFCAMKVECDVNLNVYAFHPFTRAFLLLYFFKQHNITA